MHWITPNGEYLVFRKGERRCILVASGLGPNSKMYAHLRPCDSKQASGLLTVAAAAVRLRHPFPPPPLYSHARTHLRTFRRRPLRRAPRRRTSTIPCGRRRRRRPSSAPPSRCSSATRCARACWPSAKAASKAPRTRPFAWPWPKRSAPSSPSPARASPRRFASKSAGTRAMATPTPTGETTASTSARRSPARRPRAWSFC